MAVVAVGGLMLTGATVYLSQVRRVADLRVVVSGYPTITFEPNTEAVLVASGQTLTFINSGTEPATVTRVALFVDEANDSNKNARCASGILDTGLNIEPFEIKPNESRIVSLPLSNPIGLLTLHAGRPNAPFLADVCAKFLLVFPGIGSVNETASIGRQILGGNVSTAPLGNSPREPVVLYHKASGFLAVLGFD